MVPGILFSDLLAGTSTMEAATFNNWMSSVDDAVAQRKNLLAFSSGSISDSAGVLTWAHGITLTRITAQGTTITNVVGASNVAIANDAYFFVDLNTTQNGAVNLKAGGRLAVDLKPKDRVVLGYRDGAGSLHLGDVFPIKLSDLGAGILGSNNVWTGTNQFNQGIHLPNDKWVTAFKADGSTRLNLIGVTPSNLVFVGQTVLRINTDPFGRVGINRDPAVGNALDVSGGTVVRRYGPAELSAELPGVFFKEISESVVTNTTSRLTLKQATIPANSLDAVRGIELEAAGFFQTMAVNGGTCTVRAEFSGAQHAIITLTGPQETPFHFRYSWYISLKSVGASGQANGQVNLTMQGLAPDIQVQRNFTVNTTAAAGNTVGFSGQWQDAIVGTTLMLYYMRALLV